MAENSRRSRPDRSLPSRGPVVVAAAERNSAAIEPAEGECTADPEERFLKALIAHEGRIRTYIRALLPTWSDAEDVLQNTTIVMWRKRHTFDPDSDFLAWALSISRFEVLNFRKKQRRDKLLFTDGTIELIADRMAELIVQRDSRREALESCIAKLNERDRELVRLRYQSGMTTQAVADAVGRSVQAVYKALNRIHGQLLVCIRRNLHVEGMP